MGILKLKDIKIQREMFQVAVSELIVEPGRVLGIVGKSGCGKSTLLNAIAGFESLANGEISFDEQIISGLPPEKRKIAIVFQRSALFSHLTVLENVCFGLKIKKIPLPQQREVAMQWLEKLDIGKLANRYPKALSGGEAQRVALARSLAVGFPVLLLDEPFSALDNHSKSIARRVVEQFVREQKLAAILVSHDLEDIQDLADEVCTMENGKITAKIEKRK